MAARLPSVARIPPFEPRERRLLRDLAGRGLAMVQRIASEGLELPEGTMGAQDLPTTKKFICRRWVFDTLLLLEPGPLGFNELKSGLGSLASQSLAAQLEPLLRARLLQREVLARSPLRVRYVLTPVGERTALATHVMALGHLEVTRGVLAPEEPRVAPPAAPGRAALDVDAYLAGCEDLVAQRRATHPSGDELDAARRFAAMCARRWHIDTMAVLLAGPSRYRPLRDALGASNDSLASTLRGLLQLRCVRKEESGTYALTEEGALIMGLGLPVVLFAWQARTVARPWASATAPAGSS